MPAAHLPTPAPSLPTSRHAGTPPPTFPYQRRHRHAFAAAFLAAITSASATAATFAPSIVELEPLEILGRQSDLIGSATTASQGFVGSGDLAPRPFLRRGELLEVIPGLIVTQHSGGGKANQFFLRGFNLDHGTDFAVFADGVPVNLRTHGHGQGYADTNFIIPEAVDHVAFSKGPFFARVGDFSAAGATDVRFIRSLERPFLSVTAGPDNYLRAVGGASADAGPGLITLIAEAGTYDGPFDLPEDFDRFNLFARYAFSDEDSSLAATFLA